jgi:hypothetical protein
MKNDNGITDAMLKMYIENKYLNYTEYVVADLAKALLAERSEREALQDVWDGAPDTATKAFLYWDIPESDNVMVGPVYNRTLPKTRAREKAEEAYGNCHSSPKRREEDIGIIEAAILEYAEGK